MARLQNKDKINGDFAKIYRRALKKHKREFLALLGDPPDVSNVPAEFWDKMRRELEEESAAMMLLIFLAAATQQQVSGVPAPGIDDVQTAAERYAELRSRQVASKAVETTQKAASRKFIGEPMKGKDIADAANSSVMFGDSRADSMGTTESTSAATGGGEENIRNIERREGRRIVKIWQHQSGHRPAGHANAAVNPCPICSPLEDRRLETLPAQFQSGPPGHPGCDCFIEYRFEDQQRTNPTKQSGGFI